MLPRLRPAVALALLAASPHARAHLPHEQVLALAGDPDFANNGRAYLVMAVDGSADGLGWWPYASLDHGLHWDPLARPSTNADFAGLAVVDGRPLIATDDGQLWWRDGAAWERLPSPTPYITSMAHDWGRLAIAGATGVFWTADPRGEWHRATAEPSNIVNLSPLGNANLAVRTRDGRILYGPPGALVELVDPPVDALDITQLDGTVYIGGPEGVAVHRRGFWAPCAELPVSRPDLEYASRVTRVLATDGALHAGTGQFLYDSTDGCRSWSEIDVFAEEAAYGDGAGTATSAEQSFAGIIASGVYTVVAGFRGAAVRKAPLAWHSSRINDGAFVRGLALAEPQDGDLRLWSTSYGGGLLEVLNAGRGFRRAEPPTAIEGEFGRDVAVLPTGTLAYAGDHDGYASTDQGDTLTLANVATDHLVGLASAAGRFWALGGRDAVTTLAVSDDGLRYVAVDIGEGAPMEVADAVLDGQPGVILRRVEPPGLLFSADGGDTWTELGRADTSVRGVVAWPPGVGARLVRATEVRAEWSDDAGATWNASSLQPAIMPEQLRQTESGAIIGFDDAGRGWRSLDGGDTWAPTAPLPAPQDLLAWDEYVIVATVRGVFWSRDLGDTWQQAPFQEHLSPRHEALVCLDAEGAEVSCYDPLGVGSTLRFSTRGDRVTVAADGALAFEVFAHGAALGTYVAGDTMLLPEGAWTDVEMVVTAGLGNLDDVEIGIEGVPVGGRTIEPEDPRPERPGDEAEACGCAEGEGAGLLAGLPLLWARRRRGKKGEGPETQAPPRRDLGCRTAV